MLGGLLAVCALSLGAWVDRNGVMDGYQNEYLHVGNTLDLWYALASGDRHTAEQVLLHYYWPPLFYLWPMPLFFVMGANHAAMVSANLGHLAVLLWASFRLGEAASDRAGGVMAALTVALYPSIFGNFMRYEPNLAAAAWVTAGALCLLKSRGFADGRWSVAFGLACGVGLLMDRLSLALFLGLPALVSATAGLSRGDPGRRAGRALLGLAAMLALCGAWYGVFFAEQREEIFSQSGVGEIDASGEWTEQRDLGALATWLYYPAILLDRQAGLVPGLLGLLGLGSALLHPRRKAAVPAMVVLSGMALFTLIQKKQVYYTLPMLGCLAALTAAWLRSLRWGTPLAALALLAGLHQIGLQVWGEGLPLPAPVDRWLGAPFLPAGWRDPRHPQARPPLDLRLPAGSVASAVGPGEVVVFSADQTWYEGYLLLQLRERLPGRTVRGLLSDPEGTYERARTAGTLVYVSPDPEAGWPEAEVMRAALAQHHYEAESLPPVVEVIAGLEAGFGIAGRWELPQGGVALVFRAR